MAGVTLQMLVANAMSAKGMSDRDVRDASKGLVSHETVRRIRAGLHSGNVEENTVDGLVKALDLKRSEVLAAVGLTVVADLGPWKPPATADRMTRRQRKAVEQIIGAMVEPGDGVAGLTKSDEEQPGRRLRAVARKRPPTSRPREDE